MKTVKIQEKLPNDKALLVTEIADGLLAGEIVLLPTDTVYGLAVSPQFPESVARLYQLKCRPEGLHCPIMVSSRRHLEALGLDITDPVERLLASPLVPGSLTLIIGFVGEPRAVWLKGRVEAAIRIPKDDLLLSVLERTGPLYVTSANRHGDLTPGTIPAILTQINGQPDKIIDGGVLNGVPSTLLNCRRNPPVIERMGRIARSEIAKYMGGLL